MDNLRFKVTFEVDQTAPDGSARRIVVDFPFDPSIATLGIMADAVRDVLLDWNHLPREQAAEQPVLAVFTPFGTTAC